jgi:hypothetical protein
VRGRPAILLLALFVLAIAFASVDCARSSGGILNRVSQEFDREALLRMMRFPEDIKIINRGSRTVEKAIFDVGGDLTGCQRAYAAAGRLSGRDNALTRRLLRFIEYGAGVFANRDTA